MGAVKNHFHDEIMARFDHDHDEPDVCGGCGCMFFGMKDGFCSTCTDLGDHEGEND